MAAETELILRTKFLGTFLPSFIPDPAIGLLPAEKVNSGQLELNLFWVITPPRRVKKVEADKSEVSSERRAVGSRIGRPGDLSIGPIFSVQLLNTFRRP